MLCRMAPVPTSSQTTASQTHNPTADHDDDGFQTATSNIQGVGGIISHLYQVSTPALLAASWGGLVRDGKNAEASTVEQMGKAVYGQDAFQREMDVAVING